MAKLHALAAFLGLVTAGPSAAQEAKDKPSTAPAWSVQGFLVQKREPNPDLFVLGRGTSVTAKLQLPKQFIVEIDPKACKIHAFTDNKNTDLLATPFRYGPRDTVKMGDHKAEGKYATVVFQAQGTPISGALKIRIKGDIAVTVGKDVKEVGFSDFKVGSFSNTFGDPHTNGMGALVYSGTRPLQSVVMVDDNNRETVFRVYQRSHPSKGIGRADFRANLYLPPFKKIAINREKLRITYFDTVEKITVPVDLEVGPGL